MKRFAHSILALVVAASAPAQADQENLLVVSHQEHAIVLLDPYSGERRALFRVGLAPEDVAVSPDGRTAVVANRGDSQSGTTVTVLDVASRKIVRTIALETEHNYSDGRLVRNRYHRPSGVAFVGARRVLVSCAVEGALLLVDLDEARVVAELQLGSRDPFRIVVGRDGRHAFVANRESGTVSVVDVGRMQVARSIEAGGGASAIALHPTRDELWVTNTTTNSISIVDAVRLEERLEFPCGAMPSDVAFTPDGAFALVTNMQEGNISVFETESQRTTTVIDLDDVGRDVAQLRPAPTAGSFGNSPLPVRIVMHPQGHTAYVATRRDDSVHEIAIDSWRIVRTLDAPQIPAGLAWSHINEGEGGGPRVVPGADELRRAVGDSDGH